MHWWSTLTLKLPSSGIQLRIIHIWADSVFLLNWISVVKLHVTLLRNVGSYADHTALCPRRMVIVNDRCENPRSSSIVPRSDYWSVLMSSLSVSILRPQQWKPFLSSPYFPSVRANSLHSEPYECIGPTATFRHALLQPVVLWSCDPVLACNLLSGIIGGNMDGGCMRTGR